MKRGFTLTELLLVIAIIGIMAGLSLSAFIGATELAREQRTRSIIAKIDSLIMEKWEGYRTRAVPIRIPPRLGAVDSNGNPTVTDPRTAATIRLYALRELMRMEMPERITDLIDGSVVIYQKGAPYNATVKLFQTNGESSLWKSYRRCAARALGTNWQTVWTEQFQGSECLYLILGQMHDGDKNALDFLLPEEIGDTDGDGMKEVLDGWGRPIEWLRWAPGYTIENSALTIQTSAYTTQTVTNANGNRTIRVCANPDPFDVVHCDPHWDITTGTINPACFAIKPLIISAGRDKQYDIAAKGSDSSGGQFRFFATTPPNDPYFVPTTSGQYSFGTPTDFDGDGISRDNITNHYQAVE